MHKIISTSVVKHLLLVTCYITMNSINFNIKSKWQINRVARKQKKNPATLCYMNSWWVDKMIILFLLSVLYSMVPWFIEHLEELPWISNPNIWRIIIILRGTALHDSRASHRHQNRPTASSPPNGIKTITVAALKVLY